MQLLLVTAIILIHITGPTGNRIDVNPADIVSLRQPQIPGFYDAKVKCVIYTLDASFIGSQETCQQIRAMIIQAEDQ